MGIDIYYFNKNNKKGIDQDYIWTFDDLYFLHLSNCINLYEERTGKFIDEYGELELSTINIPPLLSCVNEIIDIETDNLKLKTLLKFKEILSLAVESKRGLGFYGD